MLLNENTKEDVVLNNISKDDYTDIECKDNLVKDTNNSKQDNVHNRKQARVKEPSKVGSLIMDWLIAPPKTVKNVDVRKGSRTNSMISSHKEEIRNNPKGTVTK